MRTINLTVICFIAAGTLLCSCGGRSSGAASSASVAINDSLPADVTDIVSAVASDDSSGFSSKVNYPLERPYPLKDINNETEMAAYYKVMVDDSLKNVIAGSTKSDWSENGWRGWTVKDGQYLSVDGEIYEVNYVSAREKSIKDSLVKREKSLLPANLAKGWMPEWVMEDLAEGKVYRIDADSLALIAAKESPIVEGGEYRLSIYSKGGDLRKNPERILRGRRKMGGSIGNVNYYFDNHSSVELTDSAEYIIELYSEAGTPKLYHRLKKSGNAKNGVRMDKPKSVANGDTVVDHELKKVYWLDKVNKSNADSVKKPNPEK